MSIQDPSQDPRKPLFQTPDPSDLQSEDSRSTVLERLTEQSDQSGESNVVEGIDEEVPLTQDDNTVLGQAKIMTPPD